MVCKTEIGNNFWRKPSILGLRMTPAGGSMATPTSLNQPASGYSVHRAVPGFWVDHTLWFFWDQICGSQRVVLSLFSHVVRAKGICLSQDSDWSQFHDQLGAYPTPPVCCHYLYCLQFLNSPMLVFPSLTFRILYRSSMWSLSSIGGPKVSAF